MKRVLIVAALVLQATACGSSTTEGPGSGGSAGSSGQCGTGCIKLCEGGDCSCSCTASCEDFSPPVLDKSCATDDDCFAGVHTLDCCGSRGVLGYNLSVQASFDDYEADCTSRALCRCAPTEPRLEGGQVTSDIELRKAVCSAGQCLGTGPVNVGN